MDNKTAQPIKFSNDFTEQGNKYIEEIKKLKMPPTLQGFANLLKVDPETLTAWADKKKKDAQGNLTEEFARPKFRALIKKIEESGKKPEIIRDKKGRIVKPVPQDTNKNGTAGGPTKYDPKFIIEVDRYLAGINAIREPKLPTLEGFATHIGVHRDTINSWLNAKVLDEKGEKTKVKLYPEFSDAIKKIETIQKDQLINHGFYGGKSVNANMAIFLLKVNHKMVETNVVDLRSKGEALKQVVGFNFLPPAESEDGRDKTDNQTNT